MSVVEAERVEALVDGARWAQRDIPLSAFSELEVRAQGDKIEFVGHAAVFDRLSDDLGGFRERVQRGAFRKVLDSGPDVRFLLNHDANLLMARTTNGTLEMREDPKGLRVYALLNPDVQASRDTKALVSRGDITGMSFSFRIYPDGSDVWQEEDGELIRTIVSFGRIGDVGPVTYPAYPQTDASMRSLVRGVEIVAAGGEVLLEPLRALAQKIHRGEIKASAEERAAVDIAFSKTETVSPWMAERAFRAAASEPELRAAIPEQTRTALLQAEPPVVEQEPLEGTAALEARKRRLRLLGAPQTT